MTETQERFLRAVVERVAIESVVELHLFPSIRRGTLETGVAVIATALPVVPQLVIDAMDAGDAAADDSASPGDHVVVDAEASVPVDGAAPTDQLAPVEGTAQPRLRILTASYRSTIKGPERGKWNVEILDEAIAPRDAIEAVLRGVRHRSTEPADPEPVTLAELSSLVTPLVVAPAA
jgi:hypothetical protein